MLNVLTKLLEVIEREKLVLSPVPLFLSVKLSDDQKAAGATEAAVQVITKIIDNITTALKSSRQPGQKFDIDSVKVEVGTLLLFVTALAKELGVTIEDITKFIEKYERQKETKPKPPCNNQ